MRPNFLQGIRIADFTWAGAGPFCTKIFSDFGAEVLKVESMTRPDSVRTAGPFKDGIAGINRSGYFASRNSGKKSVALNLKQQEARQIALDIVSQSDIVSNNFSPGAMERLGLAYEHLKRVKPDIVYLSMPMCGQTGPRANLLGVGMTISAMTGIMWNTAYAPNDPVGPGTHYPDHAANPYHAAFAVLAALRHREKTGEGMEIDLAQVESTVNFLGTFVVETGMTGAEPPQIGNRSRAHAPHNIYRASGADEWVAIAVLSDEKWCEFCALMARPDLAQRKDLATAQGRVLAIEEVDSAVQAWTAGQPALHTVRLLRDVGIAVSKVMSSRDLIEDDQQLAANNYFQTVDHPEVGPILLNSPPFKIDGKRIELQRPPLFGEHTEEVLGQLLGMLPGDVSAFEHKGILK